MWPSTSGVISSAAIQLFDSFLSQSTSAVSPIYPIYSQWMDIQHGSNSCIGYVLLLLWFLHRWLSSDTSSFRSLSSTCWMLGQQLRRNNFVMQSHKISREIGLIIVVIYRSLFSYCWSCYFIWQLILSCYSYSCIVRITGETDPQPDSCGEHGL